MKHSQIIVLTGGGSGGHITPLLSLAHAIKVKDNTVKVVYIGHKGDKIDGSSSFDKIYFINAGKFRRYHGESFVDHLLDVKTIFLNIRDLFRVIISTFRCIRLINHIKPDVVFSKGSFVAVPVGIAARLKNVPIVTHDSDTIPGLANRIIGRWAALHVTGMPEEFYSYPKEKTRFTGIPVSSSVLPVTKKDQQAYKQSLGTPVDSMVLLVAGGGNGAVDVNNLVQSIASELLSKHSNVYILHFAGLANERAVEREYKAILGEEFTKRVQVVGFTNNFYKYTGAADIIISRAGATSIAEFAIQAKPLIVIPSPFLANGHQLKNADQLLKADAAVVVPNSATADELLAVINELLASPSRREELAKNIAKLAKTGASDAIADIMLSFTKGGDES